MVAGQPGEIFLSGKGLATTYCGNEEASAAKWVPNPYADSSPKASSMMCKSGDRGRIHNGSLELMGRTLQEVLLILLGPSANSYCMPFCTLCNVSCSMMATMALPWARFHGFHLK